LIKAQGSVTGPTPGYIEFRNQADLADQLSS